VNQLERALEMEREQRRQVNMSFGGIYFGS